MQERSGIFIQARSNSERLPGKIYAGLPEPGQPSLLEHIYRRLQSVGADELVVLIPEADELLADFCKARGMKTFTGPEDDVRQRFRLAARALDVSLIVRATADNPLTDPGVAAETLAALRDSAADLLSFGDLPLGVAVEAFRREALERSAPVELPEHLEHVSLHIKHNPDLFCVVHPQHSLRTEFAGLHFPRLTVDMAADLSIVRRVFGRLGAEADVRQVLELCRHEPEIFRGNEHVRQRTFAPAPAERHGLRRSSADLLQPAALAR